MAQSGLAPTGIAGLDRIFLGGIQRGNLILVEGAPGTGKTLFGVEFIYRGAESFNEPGVIVVLEASPKMLLRDAAAFDWHLEQLEQRDQIKIVSTSPEVLEQELRSPDSLLLQTAREINARRMFIDSIGLLGSVASSRLNAPDPNGTGSYRQWLQHLLDGLRRQDLTAVLAHEIGAHAEATATLDAAEFVADTVIRLQRGRPQRGVYRTLEIVKSRGQDFDEGEHTIQFTPHGLEVFRRVQAAVRDCPPQPTYSARASIGTEPLDALTGGGLLDGSVTLIVGASGSGKSLLGYQVLGQGAKNLGKRGLLITCDEHPAQVIRNAELLGLALPEQVEAGGIHIVRVSPLELQVDSFFAEVTRTIDDQKIERLVFDGLTTVANALHDQRVYREFMHGLIAFSKNRLLTTFLCYETPELFGVSRFMPEQSISSIVDNIILLSFVELGDELHRAITVAKARGSAHSMLTHEYTIEQGGIRLLPESERRLRPLPFAQYLNLVSRAPTRLERGGWDQQDTPE